MPVSIQHGKAVSPQPVPQVGILPTEAPIHANPLPQDSPVPTDDELTAWYGWYFDREPPAPREGAS